MKKLWNKWTDIALVKRILVGLILGAILGIAVPGATGIAILGDVFVSALKAMHHFWYSFFLSVLCVTQVNLTAVSSRQLSYFTCSVLYLPQSLPYLQVWHFL